MGLLTPLALAFAALSAPILLLYMLRLRRQEVLVSSTLLWQRLLRDREANRPWQRLRRNLLMLLQLLALALLTLALARPFLPTPAAASGSVVILLDASASMQATDVAPTRFEAARRMAQEALDGLGPGDVGTIIVVGPQPAALAVSTSDRGALRRALTTAAPSSGPADWEAAAALAAAALTGSASAQTLIISDGAASPALPALPGQVRFVRVGERGDNLAITALAIREGSAGPQAFLRVMNFGHAPVQTTVSFRADGRLFDARPLSLPARGSFRIAMDDLPYDLSVLEARLETEDALPLDNAAWAVRSQTAEQRVLLVTPGNIFLERALGMLPGLAVTRLSPGQPLPTEPYDLIVHDGPLTGTLPAGNLWLIGPYASAPSAVFTATAPLRSAADHPILRYVDLKDVHVLQAWAAEPPPGARVLVEAPGGPLFFVAERPEGRLAVLTFDLHQSDLPLRVAFPILTANLTGWLLSAGRVDEVAALQPGEPILIRSLPAAERVAVVAPDGSRLTLAVGAASAALTADQIGVYRLLQLGADDTPLRTDLLPVNLFDEAESDITPQETVRVGQREVEPIAPQDGRREVWPWPAGAALVVLGAEWWAYQRGRPRGRHRPGQAWTALALRGLIVLLIPVSYTHLTLPTIYSV